MEISTAIGDQSGIARSNGNLGITYGSLGQYEIAIEYHNKCLEISTEIGDQSGIAASNGNLANSYQNLGQFEKAIQYYEKALEICSAIGDQSGIAKSNGGLGECHNCVGEHEVASSYLGRAIKPFDKIFLDMVPDRNKLSYAGQYFYFHKVLMECFVSINHLVAALHVIDRGRAKQLSFCLQKQRKDFKRGMLEYAYSMRGAEQDFKELEVILEHERYCSTVLVFAFDLEKILNVWILNKSLIHRKLDVSFDVLNSSISELLEKFKVRIGRDSSFINLDISLDCSEDIIFHSEKSSRKPTDRFVNLTAHEILKKIFQFMIDPVKDLFIGNKLIIVPDKSLFFLPFSSLIDQHGCYLSQNHSIQITPSLHSLKASMKKPHDPKLSIALFVGNPTVGKVSLNGESFTPSDLPSAAKEVESASKLFKASPLLGRNAQKQVILEHLDKASIIHIAAHGEVNAGEIMLAPSRSKLETTSSFPTQESFLLTQQDIMNISVKARLVVLCCCHTGQGKVTSEGVVGTTRAFLAAGARSVLATLWPINDSATKEFMEKFYEELCQETRVCEALRKTMNIFQNHEKQYYKSFEVWAPFTIYGKDVNFTKGEIEKIKEEFFDGFVILS